MLTHFMNVFYLGIIDIYGQQAQASDIAVVLLLVLLEGVLSIDNALVLGLLAKRLPKHQQKKALTYGLVGAFVFRILAIFMATLLLKLPIMKLLGGGYLIYIAVKHFFFDQHEEDTEQIKVGSDGHPILDDGPEGISTGRVLAAFWPTVLVIELTDIAFAIDSILAALAFIPPSTVTPNPKLWVVVVGGMLGVILMRFAAVVFIRLLEKFPRFETSAYLLVIVIGLKLCLDWYFNARPADLPPDQPYHGPLDFHGPMHFPQSLAFWIFWTLMVACFAVGFIPHKSRKSREIPQPSGNKQTPLD